MFAKANAHVISFKTGNVFKNGASVIGTIKESVSVMPIKHMFKCIFSLPNILHDVISNIEETAESQTIKNFINGKRWKEIRQNYSDDDIVIPLTITLMILKLETLWDQIQEHIK
ncbi:hypothetical protein PVAND_012705 [Polypedilum vanderplanki]|uniref:Uncharacterized protein n=1 Tax=Polypedilum vanderplanki TaxID=319348 RepID=A0A9J6CNH9_POLVA|nr:hypothetical protein PVAND_012705 [Polypedilum vanderplanki]